MENPDEAKTIVNKAMLASRARNAARKAREITRKSDLSTTNFLVNYLIVKVKIQKYQKYL